MLATLNSRQIVDEIVKDAAKDNDPHDAVQISPEIVLASRPGSVNPTLAPEIAIRPEPRLDFEHSSKFAAEPTIELVPDTQAAAPSIDTAVRVAADDGLSRPKRSAAGKWLRGAFVTMLFAGGSAAATIVWDRHGETARQVFAEWTPALTSLLPSASRTAPVAPAAATDQTADQPATQAVASAPADSAPDPTQSMQSMTRDLAAMAQQIEQLKANIAELKAGQEQMAREMTKLPAPRLVPEARPVARASALAPRPPAPPVRKPKPVATYAPAYAPVPLAPPPSQTVAVPPPVATTQAVADDDGPVVRPPMPVH